MQTRPWCTYHRGGNKKCGCTALRKPLQLIRWRIWYDEVKPTHVRQNIGDFLCLDSAYVLGMYVGCRLCCHCQDTVCIIVEMGIGHPRLVYSLWIKASWACRLFIMFTTRHAELCSTDVSPPPHTHTLCQGPDQVGATRSCCDAWGTLRSAGRPLFGRKLKAFIENTYSPFFVHVLWEP